MDFDLSGMDEPTARSYVLSMIVHLRQIEGEVEELSRQSNLWQTRYTTATQAGRTDLAQQAQLQKDSAASKKAALDAEVQRFQVGVESMKRQLKTLPALQRTIDAELLLAGLSELGGAPDSVTPELRKLEADDALAELKRRLAAERS